MKNKIFRAFFILFTVMILSSCTIISKRPASIPDQSLRQYFPTKPGKEYQYKVTLGDQTITRKMTWSTSENPDERNLHYFSDGKGYTKVYSINSDSVELEGISVLNHGEPSFYKGSNPCLVTPLKVGNSWKIDAVLKTAGTRIHQTGYARIIGIETLEVEAGVFKSLKILFDVKSRYKVPETGEDSIIPAQYMVWYGENAGLIRQSGTAMVTGENKSVPLELELVKISEINGE